MRCDIGVYRLGSLFQTPSFLALPAKISDLVTRAVTAPASFDECVLTTDTTGALGPYDDPKATYADCNGDYQWRYTGSFSLADDPTAAFPSDATLSQVAQTSCGDAADAAGVGWLTYVPTQDQWNSGNHSGECWFSKGPSSASGIRT